MAWHSGTNLMRVFPFHFYHYPYIFFSFFHAFIHFDTRICLPYRDFGTFRLRRNNLMNLFLNKKTSVEQASAKMLIMSLSLRVLQSIIATAIFLPFINLDDHCRTKVRPCGNNVGVEYVVKQITCNLKFSITFNSYILYLITAELSDVTSVSYLLRTNKLNGSREPQNGRTTIP